MGLTIKKIGFEEFKKSKKVFYEVKRDVGTSYGGHVYYKTKSEAIKGAKKLVKERLKKGYIRIGFDILRCEKKKIKHKYFNTKSKRWNNLYDYYIYIEQVSHITGIKSDNDKSVKIVIK